MASRKQNRISEEDNYSSHISISKRCVHSSLVSEVYLFNDLLHDFKSTWDNIEPTGYYEFFEQLTNIMSSFSPKEAEKWSHTDTFENLIAPIMSALGYGNFDQKRNPFIINKSIQFLNDDGDEVSIRPSILICEDSKGRDYILGADSKKVKAELRKYLHVPVVTSYFGAICDRRAGKYNPRQDETVKWADAYTNLGPSDQTSEYLKILGANWGIFTDGYIWRLYNKEESIKDSEKFLEFDFSELYNLFRTVGSRGELEETEFFDAAKYFYWFFSKEGIKPSNAVVPFVDSVYKKSQRYVSRLQEDLKERFVHAMTISCNGFLRGSKAIKNEALKLVAKTSESFIFNLIFIRSCESKRILPMHQDYLPISLKIIIDKLKYFNASDWQSSKDLVFQSLKPVFGKKITENGSDIYNHILNLYDVIENGDNGFGIVGFVESIFYPEEETYFRKSKISNKDMIQLLHKIFYTGSVSQVYQIPYNILTARQLGGIYESFLEFQPTIAKEKYAYVKKVKNDEVSWQWVPIAKMKKKDKEENPDMFAVESGEVMFSPDNKERKMTGSYYTNDELVTFIVQKALGPIMSGLTSDEVLEFKVCDPSMGSGHFLVEAVDYLTREILKKSEGKKSFDKSVVSREVLDKCIYGVDLNPSAVKLSRLSLWLKTAHSGIKLERLEDQIKIGNSLVKDKSVSGNAFDWNKEFEETFTDGGFDAILGNPPWEKFMQTDLDFYRPYEPRYGYISKQEQKKVKERVLKIKGMQKEYDLMKLEQDRMLSYFKESKDYSHQVYKGKDSNKTYSGHANTYKLFIELCDGLIKDDGIIGIVLPMSFNFDVGVTGLRHLVSKNYSIDLLFSAFNLLDGKKVFDNVAGNQRFTVAILTKGSKNSSYYSKFINSPEELLDTSKWPIVKFSDTRAIFGEQEVFYTPKTSVDLRIHKKINLHSKISDSGLGNFKTGWANTSSKKSFFTKSKSKYSLISGRQFTCFTDIYSINTYIKSEDGDKLDQAQISRIALKKILPDSIKKIQATIVPKNCVLTDNVFYFKNSVNLSDVEERVLCALLNSTIAEYRIKSFISNFKLTGPLVDNLPFSYDLIKKISKSSKMMGLVEDLFTNGPRFESFYKLDKLIAQEFDLNEDDLNYLYDTCYGEDLDEDRLFNFDD